MTSERQTARGPRLARWTVWAVCWALCAVAMGCGEDTALQAEEDSGLTDTSGDATSDDATTGDAATADATTSADTTPDTSTGVDLDSPTLGQSCQDSARDCEAGQVCAGADPQRGVAGYCTVLDCQTSADCAFSASSDTFCCATYGDLRGCWMEFPGRVCGDEGGDQGDACNAGGQSDCDGESGYFCAAIYNRFDARCMMTCELGSDTCPADSACTHVGGGEGLCAPTGDLGPFEPCREDAYACEEGATCIGAFSRREPYDYCVRTCSNDDDCLDPSLWCSRVGGELGECLPKGSILEGGSCAEDRFGCEEGTFCLNAHTRFAVCARNCTNDSGCEAPGFCNIYDPQRSLGICTVRGDRQTGEPCADDVRSCARGSTCLGGFEPQPNPDAYCVATSCTVSPDSCPSGFYCAFLGSDQYICRPDGEVAAGEVCEHPTDCARDTVCVAALGGERRCAPVCYTDGDCGEGTYCALGDNDQGVCVAHGDQGAGESCGGEPLSCDAGMVCGGPEPVCLPSCTSNPQGCPSSMTCMPSRERGGPRFCYPHGSVPAGEACADPYACVPGTICTGNAASPGRCAVYGCRADDECPSGEWCFQRGEAWTLCMVSGAPTTGQPCDAGTCAPGHLCLHAGTDQAYCAEDCTGFADTCGADERCTFVGDSLNLCLPVGQTPAGGSCADDPRTCDAASVCVGVGTSEAFCAARCTFDRAACAEGTECFFTRGGLGVCVPPGVVPQDPPTGAEDPL